MLNYEVTKENEKIFLCSYPIHKEDIFSFEREEKNGYSSVRVSTVPRVQELFLNQTTLDILRMCDGERSCSDIALLMQETYPDVPKEVIMADFKKIVSLLSRFQIIDWTERNPFMAEYKTNFGKYDFELLDDTNIREILLFLEKNGDRVQWNNIMHEYKSYDELYIRDMLFNFTEDFFALRDGEELLGIVSVKYSVNVKSSVAAIGILVGEEPYIGCMLEGVTQFYSKCPYGGRVSKLKVQMVVDETVKNKKMAEALSEVGFILENISQKEYKGMDLKNYSFFLPEGNNA